jgi:hypothetical protein
VATLNVNALPQITAQPNNATLCSGSNVTFNAAANDTNDWMVDALVMNTLVSGLYIVQRINVVGYNGTTIVQDYVITGNNTNDTATALNVGVAATAATGPDVITVTMMTVELLYTQYT